MPISKSQFITLVQALKVQRFDARSCVFDVLTQEEGANNLKPSDIEQMVKQEEAILAERQSLVDICKLSACLTGEVGEEDIYEPGDWVRCSKMCGMESLEVRGRWASHTGFRSIIQVTEEENIETLYAKASMAPFLVGRADTEGWQELSEAWNAPDQVQIRLPSWHIKEVAWVLYELAGLRLHCPINEHWVFPARYSKAQVKTLLAPVLKKGGRLKDEKVLADEIRHSMAAAEFQGLIEQESFF